MDALEAVDYLRLRQREDPDVHLMVAGAVDKGNYADLFDWADAEPEQAIMLAEATKDLEEQLAEFDRRLSTGDLS